MKYLFRLPKFPVLLDAGAQLVHARSKAQFEARISQLGFTGEESRNIIDSKAEGFALYPKSMIVAPHIGMRRWTKANIIDLYNNRRSPGQPELAKTSLGNRSLEQVVKEVGQLLAQRHRASYEP
jgi:hypothetical protein